MQQPEAITLARAIPYVAAAYMGIWLIAFGYLLSLGSKVSKLVREVKILSEVASKK